MYERVFVLFLTSVGEKDQRVSFLKWGNVYEKWHSLDASVVLLSEVKLMKGGLDHGNSDEHERDPSGT